jgi:hypothetical protein
MQASDPGVGLRNLANERRGAIRGIIIYENNFPGNIWQRVGYRSDHAFDIVSFIKGWDYDRQLGGFHGANLIGDIQAR